MPRSTLILLILLVLVAGLLGYNYFAQPFADLNQTVTTQVSPSPVPQLAQTNSWQELSTQHKVAQLVAYPYLVGTSSSSQSAQLAWLEQFQPGSVTLFGTKISSQSAQETIDQLVEKLNIQPLIGVDHEGGSVQRLSGEGFTLLPSWQKICSLSPAEQTTLLTQSAQELSTVGIDLVYAPVVDVASSSGILASRTCSTNPEVVETAATNFVQIFRNNHLIPTLKHFPGIGSLSVDLHQRFGSTRLLEDQILIYNQLLIDQPEVAVMVTHVGLTDDTSNLPCSLNPKCTGELTKFSPETLVIADALDMAAADHQASGETLDLPHRAMQAIQAGSDLLLFGPKVSDQELREVIQLLSQEYESNSTFQTQVDQRLEKIWTYRQLLSL